MQLVYRKTFKLFKKDPITGKTNTLWVLDDIYDGVNIHYVWDVNNCLLTVSSDRYGTKSLNIDAGYFTCSIMFDKLSLKEFILPAETNKLWYYGTWSKSRVTHSKEEFLCRCEEDLMDEDNEYVLIKGYDYGFIYGNSKNKTLRKLAYYEDDLTPRQYYTMLLDDIYHRRGRLGWIINCATESTGILYDLVYNMVYPDTLTDENIRNLYIEDVNMLLDGAEGYGEPGDRSRMHTIVRNAILNKLRNNMNVV